MLPVVSRPEVLPATVRALVIAGVRLLVCADLAATRAAGTTDRLRAVTLPLPRRPCDEL